MQIFSVGLLYDILFLAVLLLAADRGRRRGFLSGLMGLAGTLAGIVGGVWATRAWAQTLYTDHLGVAIGEQLAKAMADYGDDIGQALDRFPFLPQPLRASLMASFEPGAVAKDIVPRLVAALEPVVLPLLQALLFLLVCLAVRIVVRVLGRMLRRFNDLPILGTFNRILGFAFGFVSGLLDCWLLAMALWLLGNVAAKDLPFLGSGVLGQSAAYRFLANFNPFTV